MLAFRLETWEEARVILVFHAVGTVMEVFKTSVGSWIYPEPSFFRVGGVPLFTGFMYAAVGSYIARAWRLFDFRFKGHPSLWALSLVALGKLGAWFLLMIISYTLVAMLRHPQPMSVKAGEKKSGRPEGRPLDYGRAQ